MDDMALSDNLAMNLWKIQENGYTRRTNGFLTQKIEIGFCSTNMSDDSPPKTKQRHTQKYKNENEN
jgi:hypothetical protein